MAGISYESVGFTEIRNDLGDFITNNQGEFPVISSYPNDIANQVLDETAAALTYLQYKYSKYREEAYMTTAKLSSSIYGLAIDRSYNIARASCPIFNAVSTGAGVTLTKGKVVGKITSPTLDLDLVYFGNDSFFPAGGVIPLHVGKLRSLDYPLTSVDLTQMTILSVSPNNGYLVDNVNYNIYLNGDKVDDSKMLEDFIVKNKVCVVTSIDMGVDVWLSEYNSTTSYGIKLKKEDVVRFEYLETTGVLPSLGNIITNNQYTLSEPNIRLSAVKFTGYDREPDSKIARLAPLLYTTAKRAVALDDFRIISNMFPLISDCFAEKDNNKCCSMNVHYLGVGSNAAQRVFTEYEIQQFNLFYLPYSVGPDIKLIPAEPIVMEWHIYVTYKGSDRPVSDVLGVFESTMIQEVTDVVSSFNLKMGASYTVGEVVTDIGKLPSVISVVVSDSNGLPIPQNEKINCGPLQYPYTTATVELIAR